MKTLLFCCLIALTTARSAQLQPEWGVTDGPPGAPGVFINQDPAAAGAAAAAAAGGADVATEVTVNCVIKSCFMVGESAGQVGLQVMIQLVWTDPKVTTGTAEGTLLAPKDTLNPDIQFLNSVHTELRKEKIMAYPGGVIRNTKRYYLTLQEMMNYKWYPFDTHLWSFDMNSFSLTSDKMVFKKGYVITDPGFETPVFRFGKNDMEIRTVDAPLFPGQNFSTARVAIVASRSTANCFNNIIFPLVIVVGLAYLSLWLSPSTALPARSGLCIISILTTLVISGSVSAFLPKISYTTWIDVFINTVLGFVALTCGLMILAHRTDRKMENGTTVFDHYARMIYPVVFIFILLVLLGVGLIAAPSQDSVLATLKHPESFSSVFFL